MEVVDAHLAKLNDTLEQYPIAMQISGYLGVKPALLCVVRRISI
jgi:hypothetical protein